MGADPRKHLFGVGFGKESPKEFFLRARVEIPNRVDQSAGREVNDALFRAEPPELAVIGQLAAEGGHVRGEALKRPALNESCEVFKGQGTQLVATAEREGETITFQSIVGLEDALSGLVIRIFIH